MLQVETTTDLCFLIKDGQLFQFQHDGGFDLALLLSIILSQFPDYLLGSWVTRAKLIHPLTTQTLK